MITAEELAKIEEAYREKDDSATVMSDVRDVRLLLAEIKSLRATLDKAKWALKYVAEVKSFVSGNARVAAEEALAELEAL